jgi:maltose phosphorylase
LRTSRLDLDDYNNDTEDGLHITSMGGTWMAFVMGFGGLRARGNKLVLNPFLPNNWKSYQFRVDFRGAHLSLKKEKEKLTIVNYSKVAVMLEVWEKPVHLEGNSTKEFNK